MELSIGEVSKRTNLSISKLRYYDEHGLIPFLKRTSSGVRKFDESALEALNMIECLKNSGMQLKEIKQFMDWCIQGDSTLVDRLNMFYRQEKNVLAQIKMLQTSLCLIKFKQWYYETAVKDKTDKFVKTMRYEDMPRKIQELYDKSHADKMGT